jgi:hypothetical protein
VKKERPKGTPQRCSALSLFPPPESAVSLSSMFPGRTLGLGLPTGKDPAPAVSLTPRRNCFAFSGLHVEAGERGPHAALRACRASSSWRAWYIWRER